MPGGKQPAKFRELFLQDTGISLIHIKTNTSPNKTVDYDTDHFRHYHPRNDTALLLVITAHGKHMSRFQQPWPALHWVVNAFRPLSDDVKVPHRRGVSLSVPTCRSMQLKTKT